MTSYGEKTRPGQCPEQQLIAQRPSMINEAREVCSAKSSSLWVFALFMLPLVPVDIRDANHPGQSSLPLVDHTEFADLKFPVPECLLMVHVCLAPDRNAGGPCCNEQPIL